LKFASLMGVLLIGVFAIPGNSKDQGFTGTWVVEKGSERPDDAPINLQTKIKQDGSGITFETVFKEPENGVVPLLYLGVMTTKFHLTFSGNTEQNTIGPFQMASKTTLDGNQMQTDWTAMVKGEPVQGHWTHTLSDDGRRLTLEIHESSGEGHAADATLHFVRK
jgi:hypothetical protein